MTKNMTYMKLLNPTITYIQANKFLKQASTDNQI